MLSLLPAIALLCLFVYLFFREIRLEQARYREADRLGDEHIMREIEKFLREKAEAKAKETPVNTSTTATACVSPQKCGDSCD